VKKLFSMSVALILLLAVTACGSKPAANDAKPADQPQQAATQPTAEKKEEQKAEFNYPEKNLNWTIAFGPGGGNDIMSRTIIDILKKHNLYSKDIIAENRQGGSGAVGWGYLNSHKGDPYQISSTSGSFITTPLVSDPGFNYESFTPVALMATDDMVLVVKGDAPYNTLEEFIEAAKTRGKKMAIGGIGAVNVDAILPWLLAKEAGFEIEYVPFQGDGENTSALLSNSIDAMMANPAEALGQIQAGQMKPLAFSGQVRIPQLPDVPTFIEKGYKSVTLPMPRGVVLAGDVPKEVQDWWVDTMKKVTETEEWKKYINDNSLTEYLLFGDDFTKYLEETNKVFKDVLIETGALKQ